MITVSNYCFLLCLGFILVASSWFIQDASAQDPSGTLVLVPPSPDPAPNEEFVVSVEILNPQNVSVFTITVEYSNDLVFNTRSDIQPGEDQFDLMDLTFGEETTPEDGNRVKRQLVLGINYDMGAPVFFTEGTLFTITFETPEIGNHWVAIIEDTHLQDGGSTTTSLEDDELPGIIVPVREAGLTGTVAIDPAPGINRIRLNETSFVDIVLSGRRRANRYQITVDPSANLGSLTVSYNADDSNVTAITNHTAGDPITLSADLWLSNDPFIDAETGHVDGNDWRVTHSDPIVATLFFTPTTTGQGSFEITEAKIFDVDDTELTLSNPDPLTVTVVDAPLLPDGNTPQITYNNTGTGPTPVITVDDGVKDGPFEIEIHFTSENAVEHVVNADASILFPRGVYGFARDEIEVGGTAGASVTTRLWEADGAQLYYARINPTETGEREVTLQVPAGVVYEVGTNLPNVASEIVTVRTNLTNPPWDVNDDGMIQEADAEFVERYLGLGLEERGEDFALYVNTIQTAVEEADSTTNPRHILRSDVNGDQYINQVDLDLVRMHIPDDDGGAQGQSDGSQQLRSAHQGRGVGTPPPDASVWMPDENLRNRIRNALGIAADENFTQEQVATLTNLTATKKRISDLTGLEYATSLRKLDLRTNRISDIGLLTGLTELTELKIGTNNISDITPLAGLTNLTHLGLAENEISDISALGSLTNLKELWLRDNNISDVTTLGSLTKLTRLNLEENEISDISALGSLTNLKELWLRDNNISDIATLGNLTQLTYLNLKENEVSNIGALGNLTRLTNLNLRYNEVSDISALGSLTNLKELWMADNNISDVSALSSLTKLKKLGLADNPILDTSPLYALTQGALKNVDITVSQYPPWDVNEDGSVDATDSALVTAALGQTGADIADSRTDVNSDGTVDQDDLTLVTDNIGTDGGSPSSRNLLALLDRETLQALDRGVLESYLSILRDESDGSLKYLRAIAMLEHILAMTRPEQTQLLANYPNPFNPETWIPYQLANASNVQITIYDVRGTVVHRLDLGHQTEGYYTHRSRAAYWDGRNIFGERVASGIYFYQLQADNISSLRKLLILK